MTRYYLRLMILLLSISFGCGTVVVAQDAEETQQPPTPASDESVTFVYIVAYISYDDRLSVRAGAGVQYEVVGTLYSGRFVEITGEPQIVEGDTWVPIRAVKDFLDEPIIEGWVNRFYLAEQMTPSLFCDDPNALAVIDDFVAAVETHDGDLLAELVSPTRGLYVRDADVGYGVILSIAEVRTFFTSTHIYDWGINGYTDDPITGSISEVMLPRLEDAVLAESSTQACQDQQEDKLRANFPIYVTQGGILGPSSPVFPDGQQNFYSILKPGTPGHEFDYIGWAIGIEYWDGQPYINALITYNWIA